MKKLLKQLPSKLSLSKERSSRTKHMAWLLLDSSVSGLLKLAPLEQSGNRWDTEHPSILAARLLGRASKVATLPGNLRRCHRWSNRSQDPRPLPVLRGRLGNSL